MMHVSMCYIESDFIKDNNTTINNYIYAYFNRQK